MDAGASLAIALLIASTSLVGRAAHAADFYIADRDVAGLAAAIHQSNRDAALDTIHLASDGLYALRVPYSDELALPPVSGALDIDGRGAEIRRNSADSIAMLEVGTGAVVRIDALTLAEGSRGALRNHGVLRISRSAIVDTTTRSESAIIFNHGDLEISHSMIGYNRVTGAGRDAAIVLNYGKLSLTDSTLADNSLARRYPTLAAAPVINFGELVTRGLALHDNTILDEFEGLASSAVLNLGIGRSGER
jgi:hypothetical protein